MQSVNSDLSASFSLNFVLPLCFASDPFERTPKSEMLCTCSGEQFQLEQEEDLPKSPESLATRDFSVNGSSSRVTDLESNSRFDDGLVDEAESDLRDTISLNYEEARALLGRLEYQRGNFDVSLQVLQGIDILSLRPKLIKSISLNFKPKKVRSKSEKLKLPINLMSVHSVSLLLEAIYLKAKSFEALNKPKDSALEYKNIIDIVETAWPFGMPDCIEEEYKLLEIFHKSLESLPKLWIQCGCFEEAIIAYKRALTKIWKLNPNSCANLQKDLAVILLYSGTTSNLEEAILLLLILMRKMIIIKEINLDYEIINHLMYALSVSNQFEMLTSQLELLLPGLYTREERWYFLALCYYSLNMNNDALNIIRNSIRVSERKSKTHVPTLLLGAKICCENLNRENSFEGVKFATRVLEYTKYEKKYIHQIGIAYHFLGGCLGFCARNSLSNVEKSKLEKSTIKLLSQALILEKGNPNILYSLAKENALQRNPNLAIKFCTKYLNEEFGGSINGWKLLIICISMQKRLKEAEGVLDIAMDQIDESGAKLEFLKLKADIQVFEGEFNRAIDTYSVLLSVVESCKNNKVEEIRNIEIEAWLDLAYIYTKLNSYQDANICLEKSNHTQFTSPKYWHIKGTLLKAESKEKEALNAFSASLSINPDYVPSMICIANILINQGGNNCVSIARSFIMNALKLEATNHEAWLNLGLISQSEGNAVEAVDCFQMAFEFEETSPVQKLV